MALKYTLENKGIPLFLDVKRDLPAHGTDLLESWYINCTFKSKGKRMGFVWHQQYIDTPAGKLYNMEYLIMDENANAYYSNGYSALEDGTHFSSADTLCVSSSYGKLEGDENKMVLQLKVPDSSLRVTCDVQDEIYNGTTGLLHMAGNSYQYAFPNMSIHGELTIGDEVYEIKQAKAWFDRQWTKKDAQNANLNFAPDSAKSLTQSWIWIGMPVNAHEAFSFWDVYTSIDGRHCFMTILKDNGIQVNVPVQIDYEDIWKSDKTGSSYPSKFTLSVPEENIRLTYTSLIDDAEFKHEEDGIHGCQCFCSVEGIYRGEPFSSDCVVEMVGNVCGEE